MIFLPLLSFAGGPWDEIANLDKLTKLFEERYQKQLEMVSVILGIALTEGKYSTAQTLELPHFRIGAALGGVLIPEKIAGLLKEVCEIELKFIPLPTLLARVGLVSKFEANASLTPLGRDIYILGGGIRYRVTKDSLVGVPASAIYFNYSLLTVPQDWGFSLYALNIGVRVSKDLLFITPYGGIEFTQAEINLRDIKYGDFTLRVDPPCVRFPKVILGLRVNLPFIGIIAEVGLARVFSGGLGVNFGF